MRQREFWDRGSGRVSADARDFLDEPTQVSSEDFSFQGMPGRRWVFGLGRERLVFEVARNPREGQDERFYFFVRDRNAPPADDGDYRLLFSGTVRGKRGGELHFVSTEYGAAAAKDALGFDLTLGEGFDVGNAGPEVLKLSQRFFGGLAKYCGKPVLVLGYEEQEYHKSDPRTRFLEEVGFGRHVVAKSRGPQDGDLVVLHSDFQRKWSVPRKPR